MTLMPLPKQWLPGFIRWPVRTLVLPFVLLDLGAQWVARQIIRPPYERVGKCLRRGTCCHRILIPRPRSTFTFLFYLWHSQFNGFYLKENAPENEWLVMGCRYLREDGGCKHYRLRPTICRTWPLIRHFGHPQIIKGCGFRAIPRTKK